MRTSFVSWSIVLVALAGCAPAEDVASVSGAAVETTRCEIAGSGDLDEGDFVEGEARGEVGGPAGRWLHEVTDGTVVLGAPDYIFCSINGVRIGETAGPATIDGQGGYTFAVQVHDFHNPHAPTHHLPGEPETQTIRATRRYCPSRWEDGSVLIDGTALVTIPEVLDVVVGNAANQWARIEIERADRGDRVTCHYRGGAGTGHPDEPDELAGGLEYTFTRCTGDDHGEVVAGSVVEVSSMTLRVQSGASHLPSRRHPQTTVSVDVTVRPMIEQPPLRDLYHLVIEDSVSGVDVFERDGFLATGDLRVELLE